MWLWVRGSGWISTPGVQRGTTNMPFVHITKRMSATQPPLVNHVATQYLVEEPELELAVAGAAELLVEKDGPEVLVLDLVLKALHQRLDLRVLGADRVGEHVIERFHLLAAEALNPVELLLELGFRRKVPGHGASFSLVRLCSRRTAARSRPARVEPG